MMTWKWRNQIKQIQFFFFLFDFIILQYSTKSLQLSLSFVMKLANNIIIRQVLVHVLSMLSVLGLKDDLILVFYYIIK